jgi:hypothetical protein
VSSSKLDGTASLLVKVALAGLDVVNGDLDGLSNKLLSKEFFGFVSPVGLFRFGRAGERMRQVRDREENGKRESCSQE